MIKIIVAKDLTKSFTTNGHTQEVLKGIDLEISDREFITIVGKSGSGKTTLINCLGLLESPSSGEIYYENNKVDFNNIKQVENIRAEYIGFVFQKANLINGLNSLENVMLAMTKIEKRKDKKELALELLANVGLKGKENSNIRNLSGGEQQRVSIAKAIGNSPKVLICDEPTGSLDYETGKKIVNLLLDIQNKIGTTLIVVTHDEELSNIGNRKLLIKKGELYEC